MFAVLRYVPRRGRRIEVIRTDVPLGAPFYTLCVPTRRKTDWSAVRRLLRGVPLLLPEGMVIPPEIEPSVFRPKRLPLLLAAYTAAEHSPYPPGETRLGVFDPDGALCGRTERLLTAAGDVRIVTARPERFASDVRQAMERYGAVLSVGQSASLLIDCNILACANTAKLPAGCTARTVWCLVNGSGDPHAAPLRTVTLPPKYNMLCPAEVNVLHFASALYECCGVAAMENSIFR
ncbi:MAG: hypothetical protein IKI42_10300 [Clostridia bacterium]|nr:hypothetical protein [Clostridia bacterium]